MSKKLIAVLSLALLWGGGITGGGVSAQAVQRGWIFSSLPATDLWFHGMAVVDPFGPGPLPLYDTGYPNRVRRAKEAAGVFPTALDDRAGYFQGAFRRDPAFEILHFLPLYFAGAGRTEVFTALELIAMQPTGIPRAPSQRTALGMAAVGSVLTTQAQRTILGEFIAVLRAEWDGFFQSYWQEAGGATGELETTLQALWGDRYQPALGPLLAGLKMNGGTVTLSPALWTEGRVFAGVPQDPMDNVLVVARPTDVGNAKEAVYSMLRELSFPLVRQAMEKLGEARGATDQGESLVAQAAVYSGALILEMYLPEEISAYKEFFLSRTGGASPSAKAADEAFRSAFAPTEALETALREEIITTVTTGGEG